jgi:hypothetical protein
VLLLVPLAAGGVARLVSVSNASRIQAYVGLVVVLIALGMYLLRRQNRFALSYLFVSGVWLALAGFLLWHQ